MSAAATLPSVRGKLTAQADLAKLVWFKSGGSAEWLFEPKDTEDLQEFLRNLDPETQVPSSLVGMGPVQRSLPLLGMNFVG